MPEKLTIEKTKLLENLFNIYRKEVNAIHAINAVWKQLKDKAKDKCAEDFDKALIARETILEELLEFKTDGIKVDQYDAELFAIDQLLLDMSTIAKLLYGMDVKVFLGVKALSSKK
jgi:hypothetical protein